MIPICDYQWSISRILGLNHVVPRTYQGYSIKEFRRRKFCSLKTFEKTLPKGTNEIQKIFWSFLSFWHNLIGAITNPHSTNNYGLENTDYNYHGLSSTGNDHNKRQFDFNKFLFVRPSTITNFCFLNEKRFIFCFRFINRFFPRFFLLTS